MATGRERMARLRRKRLSDGVRQVTVWLDQASIDRLVDLRRPGEHDSAVVQRALLALEREPPQGSRPVTSDATPPHRAPRPVTSDVSSDAPPAIAPDDATLFAVLQEAQDQHPVPTYAAIAAQLGLPAGTVSRKAAAWIKAGALKSRPLGGARPRRRHDAPT
jgi:hypothetical protein